MCDSTTSSISSSSGKNGTSLLKEKCDKAGITFKGPDPENDFSRHVSGHWAVKWSMEYETEYLEKRSYGGEAQAKSKLDAQHKLCKQIWDQINIDEEPFLKMEQGLGTHSLMSVTSSVQSLQSLSNGQTLELDDIEVIRQAQNGNFIGELKEMCDKDKKLGIPIYLEIGGVSGETIFTISCKLLHLEEMGTAKDKKTAKKVSAFKMMQILRNNSSQMKKTEVVQQPSTSQRILMDISSTPASLPVMQVHDSNPGSSFKIPAPLKIKQEPADENENLVSMATRVLTNVYYWPHDVLGTGASSTVYKGFFEVEKVPAAVKKLNSVLSTKTANEIELLRKLKDPHPNIVQYYATERFNNQDYIAMELAQSTLEEVLPNSSPEETWSFLKNAADGVAFLHSKLIVHRDLKPANILIFEKAEGKRIAKLADFGISREVESLTEGAFTDVAGTRDWMSPEALSCFSLKKFNATDRCDIYTLGVIIFYSLSNQTFPLSKMELEINWEVLGINWRPTLKNLLTPMFAAAATRPKMGPIQKHPFFWDGEIFLNFVTELANEVKLERQVVNQLDDNYDSFCFKYFGRHVNWKRQLCDKVLNFLKNSTHPQKYDGSSVYHLAKFIRDKDQHRDEWRGKQLEQVFGKTKESYGSYFMQRFPELAPFLYTNMQKYTGMGKIGAYYVVSEEPVFAIMK